MFHALPAADSATIAALIAVSFPTFIVGTTFRKWPEKVAKLTENIDGYAWLISPAANHAMIVQAGFLLVGISFGTLIVASTLL